MKPIKNYPVPVHKKMQHLSNEEIMEVAKQYFFNNTRASELCKKYNIVHKHYASFKQLINVRENIDYSCAVHDVYSHQKYKDSYIKWEDPYCPVCHEPLVSQFRPIPFQKTVPSSVKDTIFRSISSEENKTHLKNETKKLTLEMYTTLSLPIKAFIAVWYMENPEQEGSPLKAHWIDSIKICPHELMKVKYLTQLEEHELIDSSEYLMQEIIFDEALERYFAERKFLLDGTPKEFFNLWWDIAFYEALEYYSFLMNESELIVHQGPKTKDTIRYLIRHLSVGLAFTAIWRGVKAAQHIYMTKGRDLKMASNSVQSAIKSFGDKLISGEIERKIYSRTRKNAQSALSKFFAEEMTSLKELGFTTCPSIMHLNSKGNTSNPYGDVPYQ